MSRWITPGLAGSAILVLLSVTGWTVLSASFVYGVAHSSRPILAFLGLYLIGWIGLCGAVVKLIRRPPRREAIVFVLAVGILARVILIPSELILEHDVYRYILDGQVLVHGGNPYEWTPEEIDSFEDESFQAEIERESAQLVLSRVAYPWIATVYPPAAQVAFGIGALLSGWNWLGIRILFLLFDLFSMAGIIYFLKLSERSSSWVLFYAWNPLVLKEVANSVHLDVMVGSFLVWMIVCLLQLERNRGKGWLMGSAFLFALATLTKIYPLILLPACSLWLWKKRSAQECLLFGFLTLSLILLAFLPFSSIGVMKLFRGISEFASFWIMNHGAFELMSISPAPRLLTFSIIALAAFLIPLLVLMERVDDLLESTLWLLLLWFLLIPTGFPWYAIPIVSLAALKRGANRLLWPILLLSGVFAAYYMVFYFDYHHYSIGWWTWTRRIEHGLVWASMAFGLMRVCRIQVSG